MAGPWPKGDAVGVELGVGLGVAIGGGDAPYGPRIAKAAAERRSPRLWQLFGVTLAGVKTGLPPIEQAVMLRLPGLPEGLLTSGYSEKPKPEQVLLHQAFRFGFMMASVQLESFQQTGHRPGHMRLMYWFDIFRRGTPLLQRSVADTCMP
mmetsp:Transcript_77653/g.240618  ORF Transcript_77653/g.240618 Transcript_77653/m.240618 type:complete len:150 (-) Transcript_77653:1378-1827(-)